MSRYTEGWAELRDLVTGNFTFKLLALAFALMMWLWVQSEQVVEDRARVRLEWILPDGLMLVEAPLDSATVTVEGVQAFVRSVRQKDLSIEIDLSRAREGEVSLDLSNKAIIGIPGAVRVISVSPNTLKVQLDRVLKRRVTIVPTTRGEVADGFRIGAVTVSPDRVELVGPASLLRGLTEVATDIVDVSGLREDAEFDVALAVQKSQISTAQTAPIAVAVKVVTHLTERTFDAVRVELEGGGDYVAGASTVSVTLKGPTAGLAAVDPGALRVVVHVPEGYAGAPGEARAGEEGLRYEVVQPAGEGVRVVTVVPSSIPLERR